jgi:hypothetical protein
MPGFNFMPGSTVSLGGATGLVRLTERGIRLCRPSALSIMFVIRNQNPRDDPIEVDCSARSSPRTHSQRLRRSERWPSSSAPMLRRRYAGRRFQSIATGLHGDEDAFRIINRQDAVAEIGRSHSDHQRDQWDVAHEVDINIKSDLLIREAALRGEEATARDWSRARQTAGSGPA